MIDHPSNGVSVWGHLKPAYVDEELYLRRLFDDENNDCYTSGWTGILILLQIYQC